jgi:glutaredoxin
MRQRSKSIPVTLYSIPGCLMCLRAKRFLRGQGVRFREINVLLHPGELWRFLPVCRWEFPVIKVGDQAVHGFDRSRWSTCLGRSCGDKR